MTPTTLRTLRPALATAIRGITPSDTSRTGTRWKPVDRVSDVPNTNPDQIRRFYLQFVVDEATNASDGIFGCGGVEKEVPLRIWTNYGGITEKDEETEFLIEEDGQDLWLLLDSLRDPNTNGFIGPAAIETPSWIYEGDDPGAVWGYHEILIRWLARNS